MSYKCEHGRRIQESFWECPKCAQASDLARAADALEDLRDQRKETSPSWHAPDTYVPSASPPSQVPSSIGADQPVPVAQKVIHETFNRKCWPCNGRGYYGSNPKDTCNVCRGRGDLVVPGKISDYAKCWPCEEWGYYRPKNKETCTVCGGIGLVFLGLQGQSAFLQNCYPCGQWGYYRPNPKDTCKVCHGKGKIIVPGAPSEYQQCKPCGGWGYYGSDKKDTCKVCSGVGLVRPAEHGNR
jgi:DnaJ-class molecular chaperone